MSNKDFFVTAPSNTEFEGNKTENFTIPFQPPINLRTKYEVALREISVPNTFNSFQPLKHRTFFFSVRNTSNGDFKIKTVLNIDEIYYENLAHLIENINLTVSNQMMSLQPDTGVTEDEFLKLEYLPLFRKIKITAPLSKSDYEQKIRFLPYLSQILGFNEALFYPEHVVSHSNELVFLNNEITVFYILLDNIIEPEYVGGRKVPLLRQIIVNTNTNNDFIQLTYDRPLYKKVVPNFIPSIRIEIVNEQFEPVQFNKGPSYVVLHFKPVHQ